MSIECPNFPPELNLDWVANTIAKIANEIENVRGSLKSRIGEPGAD